MSPSFTIVVPAYAGMPYIRECLASALSQTYPHFNVAVLATCGVTDGTLEYLASIDDPRLTVQTSDRPIGIEGNWARILSVPCNEYLVILATDDSLRSDCLAVLARLIEENPGHPVYRTNVNLIDTHSRVIYRSGIRRRITRLDYLRGRLSHTYFETAAGYCYRWTDYLRIGGIDCHYKLLSMDDKLIMQIIGGDSMIVAPEHAANYRTHPESVSGTPDPDVSVGGFLDFFTWVRDLHDPRLDKVVRDFMPFHLRLTTGSFPPDALARFKQVYGLFGCREPSWFRYALNRLKVKFLTLGYLLARSGR